MTLAIKILIVLYAIALIPSFIMAIVFIRTDYLKGKSKLFTFLSIWLIMPFYMIKKLFDNLKKVI